MIANKNPCPKAIWLILLLTGFHACFSNTTPHSDDTRSLVDSLIQIQRINKRLLVVSFGADAVSAIDTEKGTVVIDAGISTGLTQKYRRRIEQAFQKSRFTLVINTHAHHDHNRGNSVFPEAQVLGHENVPGEIEEYWKDPGQIEKSLERIVKEYEAKVLESSPHSEDWYRNYTQQIRYQGAYEDAVNKVPIRIPDLLFSDSLWIDMGDLAIELKYFGSCHSSSDILIYIPELKILFCGDLMFRYGRPSIRDNSMTDQELWQEAIAWTNKRMDNIETVIGGHGQVLTRDDLQAFHQNLSEKML